MTGFQLTASLISSLAWPGTLVTLVVLFRKPLGRLIFGITGSRQLKKVVAGPVELEWEQEAAAAAEELATAIDDRRGENSATEATRLHPMAQAQALAVTSPQAAIMMAAVQLEEALADALRRHGQEVPARPTLQALLDQGLRTGVVPAELEHPLRSLRRLRNEAAHSSLFNLTPARAALFVVVASGAVAILDADG